MHVAILQFMIIAVFQLKWICYWQWT